MTKYCANLTTLFPEYPFLERFDAARSAGFDTVEVLFPYDHPVPDILEMLGRNELSLAMISCPPPNYTGGDRGFAAVPGRTSRFQQDFKRTHRVAKALGAKHIHVMAGIAAGPDALATYLANLRWAAGFDPDQSLTIEPMSDTTVPGYFLNDCVQALEIIKDVCADNLGLQFDTCHVHEIHGDVAAIWDRVKDHVIHIQLSQSPGRKSPDVAGDIDIAGFVKQAGKDGYKGWISGEYTPDGLTSSGLAWVG
ncbi:TIM barrel protein [Yoonia sp.]|uniref:hydroxypyruvate isomerase family protein n=1 Tax=Yoonia sp. TaxID=2212373 RepID=UPI00239E6BAA|nr:TIM barrel protein [Yoonia sp.]MDE0852677.1 TIM barrel protein [Yoonia sp.]